MIYGAGDGNRTHVRSLGSFYTAIVRRPLVLNLIDYTRLSDPRHRSLLPEIDQNHAFLEMFRFSGQRQFRTFFVISHLETPDSALIDNEDRDPKLPRLRLGSTVGSPQGVV